MNPDLRGRLLNLLCTLAYREGDFTLSSGLKSDYYINGKQVTLDAEGAWLTGTLFLAQLPPETQAVGGLTLGADPLATAVSLLSYLSGTPLPAFIVRKQTKGYGAQQQIESPPLAAGSAVVILEDTVTTGGSALQAIQAVENVGWRVIQVLAIADRNQGAKELFAAKGYAYHPLFGIDEIRSQYRALGLHHQP